MIKNISIIGGDLRIVKLSKLLKEDDYKIYTYALEKAKVENKCKTLDEVIEKGDIIIGGIPFSSNKIDINAPFSDERLKVEDLLNRVKEKTFIAGIIQEKNNVIDILKREELAILNAIATAEGAIKIAIEETLVNLHSSKVLVMGFGRCGKVLANMLKGIGANVHVEARKAADIAWIKAYGYIPVNLTELNNYLNRFDIIFNTIPAIILDGNRLKLLKKDCLVIDIASNPGGISKEDAKAQNIKLIWALSLPGKVSPYTSAEFIKETLYNIFTELK